LKGLPQPWLAPSLLQNEIASLSRLIAALAIAAGAAVFVIGHAIGLPVRVGLVFAIGIVVANVPEGLLPTVTLSMAMAARRMARRRTLVRHLPCVETLGSVADAREGADAGAAAPSNTGVVRSPDT
jgi:sodium/potassium-transporting ATPase subunit alpha